MIRFPDLIFAENLPTFSSLTFELGIVPAASDEHEIDIDQAIAKRSKTDETASKPQTRISTGNVTSHQQRPKSLAFPSSASTSASASLDLVDKNFVAKVDKKIGFADVVGFGGREASAPPSRFHTEVKLRRAKSSTLATTCAERNSSGHQFQQHR